MKSLSLSDIAKVLLVMVIVIIIPESRISERLINSSVTEGFQKLLFLFNPMKFTSDVFSDISKVFQINNSLSEALFKIG